MFREYLKLHRKGIAVCILFSFVARGMFSLYHLPAGAVIYTVVICFFFGLIFLAADYRSFCRRHRQLEQLKQDILVTADGLPVPSGLPEQDYQEIIAILAEEKQRLEAEAELRYQELVDYYTIWAHQIKTPIAAMRLLLQSAGMQAQGHGTAWGAEETEGGSGADAAEAEAPERESGADAAEAEKTEGESGADAAEAEAPAERSRVDAAEAEATEGRSGADAAEEGDAHEAEIEETAGMNDTIPELQEELRRIEQYVGMVLCYLRLDAGSTDYVIREYDLDAIVRQAVRKNASLFIRKKLRLVYEPLQARVVTDEKWLLFVMEQILSNALKYTPSGRAGAPADSLEQPAGTIWITLEAPKTLCIRDNGIGISPEDLPRIFEKGYTGCNGRTDKKASGIGMYLCRRICDNLGHRIIVTSKEGEGTEVRLDLKNAELEFE